MFFSIGATSAIKEDVAKFINFFIGNNDAVQILGVERGIPCDASARETLAPTLDEQGQTGTQLRVEPGRPARPDPPPPPPERGGRNQNPLLRVKSSGSRLRPAYAQNRARQQFYDEAAAILARAGR